MESKSGQFQIEDKQGPVRTEKDYSKNNAVNFEQLEQNLGDIGSQINFGFRTDHLSQEEFQDLLPFPDLQNDMPEPKNFLGGSMDMTAFQTPGVSKTPTIDGVSNQKSTTAVASQKQTSTQHHKEPSNKKRKRVPQNLH